METDAETLPIPPIEVSCCFTCKYAVAGILANANGVDRGAYDALIPRLTFDRVTKCSRTWDIVKNYYTCGSYLKNG